MEKRFIVNQSFHVQYIQNGPSPILWFSGKKRERADEIMAI